MDAQEPDPRRTPARRLRELLAADAPVVAPGAYDALGAKLIAQAGFGAVYMTGSGVSASMGFPDYGLLTLSEMAERAGLLARSVRVPVIADADTGYGNELNVTRTVREYESRGVAAIHIEDQVAPKRCGHLDGKEVVPRAEFIAKIRAAVDARRDPDFVLIARTDARLDHGLDEAVLRARLALDAGADIAFVEAAQSLQELADIPRQVGGPCLLNQVPGGRTPLLDVRQAAELGYRMVIFPSLALGAAVPAIMAAAAQLQASGRVSAPATDEAGLKDRFRRLGAAEWDAIRTRYRDAP